MQNKTDIELYNDWLNGNQKSFNILYAEYHGLMFHKAYKVFKNRDKAEDVVQTAWEKICRTKPNINTNLKGYLARTTHNAAIDIYRKKSKTNTVPLEKDIKVYMEEELFSNEDEDINMMYKIIEEELSITRYIAVKGRLEGKSYKELSKETGISANTLRTSYNQGKKELAKGKLKYFLKKLGFMFIIFLHI